MQGERDGIIGEENGITEEEKRLTYEEIADIDRQLEELEKVPTVFDKGKTRPVKKADFHLDKASGVEIKEPEWLIPGYIPKYGITTIAGEGGVGKTSLWCSIVASITTGKLAREREKFSKQQEAEQQESDFERRERELIIRELKADARDALDAKGLPTCLSKVLRYDSKEAYEESMAGIETAGRDWYVGRLDCD